MIPQFRSSFILSSKFYLFCVLTIGAQVGWIGIGLA